MGKGIYSPAAPTVFDSSDVAFLFGRKVPNGVRGIEVLANTPRKTMKVTWRANGARHEMDIDDWDDDTLDALMVAMRMTCS